MLALTAKILADLMPSTLCSYTMATSTEMMKDRTVIETVVREQKRDKNERNYRVFQAMRLMRREYMKMLMVDNLSEDGSSEYGDEVVARSVASDSNVSGL